MLTLQRWRLPNINVPLSIATTTFVRYRIVPGQPTASRREKQRQQVDQISCSRVRALNGIDDAVASRQRCRVTGVVEAFFASPVNVSFFFLSLFLPSCIPLAMFRVPLADIHFQLSLCFRHNRRSFCQGIHLVAGLTGSMYRSFSPCKRRFATAL